MPASPSAVLLDVDGTLVDTTYLHALAWWRAMQEAGEPVPMWRLHRLIGMGSDQLLAEVCGRERPDLEEGWARHFEELRPEIVVLPGATELVKALKERGAAVWLATSGRAEDVEHIRSVLDVETWIDGVVNSSEVEASKPAPDIFRLALERAGVEPTRSAVVGDTVWDVEAAAACGVPCVGVLTGGFSQQELREAGATEVYDDVAGVVAELDTGPLQSYLAGS